MKNGPITLVILDGFGYRTQVDGNAASQASMPNWQSFIATYPNTLLNASGSAVGLPDGVMGNSEVGHRTIGAGRAVPTILLKLTKDLTDRSFYDNKLIVEHFERLKQSGQSLHLMGLLSDAGVHSHQDQLHALLTIARTVGLKNVFVHAFLDGRDCPVTSAKTYLDRLRAAIADAGVGTIASLHGRYYAMDRDNNWDRTEKSFETLIGHTPGKQHDWLRALQSAYDQGLTDEFMTPIMLDPNGNIQTGDGLFFFNFRPDRARQLTRCFLEPERKKIDLSFFISTTLFDESFAAWGNEYLYERKPVTNTLLEVLSSCDKKLYSIAETEKYAHITYFFNGEKEQALPNEQRILIESRKAKDYVDYPCMSANEITQHVVESLESDPADFYLINYANADMVGHSGNLAATIKACEVLDQQLAVLHENIVTKRNGTLFIVADHGNAEEMIDPSTGKSVTSHSTNPVPFIAASASQSIDLPAKQAAGLSCIARIITKTLGCDAPDTWD